MSPSQQQELRGRVVAAVLGGMVKASAARAFGVSRTSIDSWLARHARGGAAALASGKRGRKPSPRLSAAQVRQAQRLVRDKCPDQLKLPFALWTRQAVRELLAERFGVRVSLSTAGRWLKEWGYTPAEARGPLV